MVRCFIAIDTVTEKLKYNVIQVQQLIKKYNIKASLQNPDTLHITLKFLGEIPEIKVKYIEEALNKIDFQKFKIIARGLGGFPSLRKPRVIFINVEKNVQIQKLYQMVETLMQKLGFPRETREFKPHITIARVKSPSRFINDLYSSLLSININEEVLVESVKLKKSILTYKGAIYEDLVVVKLK